MQKIIRLIRLPRSRRHKVAMRLVTRLLREDAGGEVLEYSLVAGLIVVAAISVIGCVGTKIVSKWNTLNSSL
jgi:pilus assembly protein Flp/PilA